MIRTKKLLFMIGKVICIISAFFLLGYYIYFFYECYKNEQLEKNEIRLLLKKWQEQSIQEEIDNNIQFQDITENDLSMQKNQDNTTVYANFHPEEATTQQKIESNDDSALDNNDNNSNKKENYIYDCILMIPDIAINKYVYTGGNREKYLEQYNLITAAQDMKYQNGGNYIICGHYSKLYGHSLNRLKELNVGDEVIIANKGISDKYKVASISYINMKNTTQYCSQTNERELTIISCAKYKGKDKYLVVKCKYMNNTVD